MFLQTVNQNLGHRHAAHACRRFGVRNHRFIVGNAPRIVVVRNDGYGVVDPNRLFGKIHVAPAERKHFADAQPRKERRIAYRFQNRTCVQSLYKVFAQFGRNRLVFFRCLYLSFTRRQSGFCHGIGFEKVVVHAIFKKLSEQKLRFLDGRQCVPVRNHLVEQTLQHRSGDLVDFHVAEYGI